MYEVRLKIDKVVNVSSIIRKVVYETLGIEVNSFYKKKIETPEKDLYIYIFEYVDTQGRWHRDILDPIPTYGVFRDVVTITVIASVKTDSTVIAVILPSDERNDPNNSIVLGLKAEGFKIVMSNVLGH